MAETPWREAIIDVLRAEGEVMHYTAIAERVVADGLRQSVGATPAATVASVVSTSLKNDGEDSPFQRVGRGEYILKSAAEQDTSRAAASGEGSEGVDEEELGPIHAFGIFWDRESVRWIPSPSILGQQQIGADRVDMCAQLGVYLLHDVREVVYVGRCTERPLGRRLYEHTVDRLKTRWNRFSWFGLCPIKDDGSLAEPRTGFDVGQLVAAMEALLIEALEPPQNRRRGDGFTGIEFIQAEDPEVEKKQMRALMDRLQERLA